jgi:hypothetical protein
VAHDDRGLLHGRGGLIVAGSALHGDGARAVALLAAGAFTGFAAVAVGLGSSARSAFRHPGPVLLTATAVLAWWGRCERA